VTVITIKCYDLCAVERLGLNAPQSSAFDKISCLTCKTTFTRRDEQVLAYFCIVVIQFFESSTKVVEAIT